MKSFLRKRLKKVAYALFAIGAIAVRGFCQRMDLSTQSSRGQPRYQRARALFGHAGIELNVDAQLATLRGWKNINTGLFESLRKDRRINTSFLGQPYIHNGMYHKPDAEIYASMILQHKPRQIIELGAGFSTSVARKTLKMQAKANRQPSRHRQG
jgi:hypothetical protein